MKEQPQQKANLKTILNGATKIMDKKMEGIIFFAEVKDGGIEVSCVTNKIKRSHLLTVIDELVRMVEGKSSTKDPLVILANELEKMLGRRPRF